MRSKYHRVQYFWLTLRTPFVLIISTKRCLGFFLFGLDLELFAKVKKDLVSTHSFFTFFFNNSRSKQKRKYPEHPFVDIVKQETCAKFQQKRINFVGDGAPQSFQFFRQITWFHENNRALPKFRYRI